MTLASAVAKGCAFLLTAGVAALGAATGAVAQDTFPSKPVKLIVPYPPGGASDITARLVGQKLSEPWGRARRSSECERAAWACAVAGRVE
jgi:hypothetical protein